MAWNEVMGKKVEAQAANSGDVSRDLSRSLEPEAAVSNFAVASFTDGDEPYIFMCQRVEPVLLPWISPDMAPYWFQMGMNFRSF